MADLKTEDIKRLERKFEELGSLIVENERIIDIIDNSVAADNKNIEADPELSTVYSILRTRSSKLDDAKEEAKTIESIVDDSIKLLKKTKEKGLLEGAVKKAVSDNQLIEWIGETMAKFYMDLAKMNLLTALNRITGGARQERLVRMRGLTPAQRREEIKMAFERSVRLSRYGRAGLFVFGMANFLYNNLVLGVWRRKWRLGALSVATYIANRLSKRPYDLLKESLWTEEEAHTPEYMNYNGPGTHFESRLELPASKNKGSASFFYPRNLQDAIAFEHDILYASSNLKLAQLADIRYIRYTISNLNSYIDRLNKKGHNVDLNTWKRGVFYSAATAIALQALTRALGIEKLEWKDILKLIKRLVAGNILTTSEMYKINTAGGFIRWLFSQEKSKDLAKIILGPDPKVDPVLLESLLSLDEKPLVEVLEKENPKYVDILNRGINVADHMYGMMSKYGQFDDKGDYILNVAVNRPQFTRDLKKLHKDFNAMNDIQESIEGEDRGFRKVSIKPNQIDAFIKRIPTIKYERVVPSPSLEEVTPFEMVTPSATPVVTPSEYLYSTTPSASPFNLEKQKLISPSIYTEKMSASKSPEATTTPTPPPTAEPEVVAEVPVEPAMPIVAPVAKWKDSKALPGNLDYFKGKINPKGEPVGKKYVDSLKKALKRMALNEGYKINFRELKITRDQYLNNPSMVYKRVMESAWSKLPQTPAMDFNFKQIIAVRHKHITERIATLEGQEMPPLEDAPADTPPEPEALVSDPQAQTKALEAYAEPVEPPALTPEQVIERQKAIQASITQRIKYPLAPITRAEEKQRQVELPPPVQQPTRRRGPPPRPPPRALPPPPAKQEETKEEFPFMPVDIAPPRPAPEPAPEAAPRAPAPETEESVKEAVREEQAVPAYASLKPKFISPAVEILKNTQPIADFNQFNSFGYVERGSEGDGIAPKDNPLKMVNMLNEALMTENNLVRFTRKFGMDIQQSIEFEKYLIQSTLVAPPSESFKPFNPNELFKYDSIFEGGSAWNPSYLDSYYAFSDIDALNSQIAASNLYGRDL